MTERPIIDAGPSLTFLSINQQRLLIGVLGRLSVPETVEDEVLRKSAQDRRFRTVEPTWRRLTPKWLQVLSDDPTPDLAAVIERITRLPLPQRMQQSQDLGELMVVAHAVVGAESGKTMRVLIDDGRGAQLATAEAGRLDRLRRQGKPVGRIELVSTLTVFELAARKGLVSDRAAMRDLYRRMRDVDDGLPPVERTRLLSKTLWTQPSLQP
ncbi:PIN domain-containing protein [Amycolatopsis panacis]|uniref:Uncharacterized protein n=1 Tax=Amycolatopsis panacis TaxID=2340917 RepID=A0A419I6G4_9PSEU|nr:hypothetical protein [Amycolatopsis panacis]RJQ87005.1 hypothetical protein D5S19_10135 [Amycolatopsis panacis]